MEKPEMQEETPVEEEQAQPHKSPKAAKEEEITKVIATSGDLQLLSTICMVLDLVDYGPATRGQWRKLAGERMQYVVGEVIKARRKQEEGAKEEGRIVTPGGVNRGLLLPSGEVREVASE